jgi:hypothetical protein
MTDFLQGMPVSADGILMSQDTGTNGVVRDTGRVFTAGVGGAPGNLLVESTTIANTDVFLGGMRYSATGALRVLSIGLNGDGKDDLPAGVMYLGGIAVNPDGRVCYSANPICCYLGGVPVTAGGCLFSSSGPV